LAKSVVAADRPARGGPAVKGRSLETGDAGAEAGGGSNGFGIAPLFIATVAMMQPLFAALFTAA
jgi:hypothetical protein